MAATDPAPELSSEQADAYAAHDYAKSAELYRTAYQADTEAANGAQVETADG